MPVQRWKFFLRLYGIFLIYQSQFLTFSSPDLPRNASARRRCISVLSARRQRAHLRSFSAIPRTGTATAFSCMPISTSTDINTCMRLHTLYGRQRPPIHSMPPSQTIRRHAATVPRRPARNRIFLPPHAPEQPRGSDAHSTAPPDNQPVLLRTRIQRLKTPPARSPGWNPFRAYCCEFHSKNIPLPESVPVSSALS